MKLYQLERIKPIAPSPDGRDKLAAEIIVLAESEQRARQAAAEHDNNLVWTYSERTDCTEIDMEDEQVISVYSL